MGTESILPKMGFYLRLVEKHSDLNLRVVVNGAVC
jgi:hypothetical protein